jgi:hypothetical protein
VAAGDRQRAVRLRRGRCPGYMEDVDALHGHLPMDPGTRAAASSTAPTKEVAIDPKGARLSYMQPRCGEPIPGRKTRWVTRLIGTAAVTTLITAAFAGLPGSSEPTTGDENSSTFTIDRPDNAEGPNGQLRPT